MLRVAFLTLFSLQSPICHVIPVFVLATYSIFCHYHKDPFVKDILKILATINSSIYL